jgi:hypothetical protein
MIEEQVERASHSHAKVRLIMAAARRAHVRQLVIAAQGGRPVSVQHVQNKRLIILAELARKQPHLLGIAPPVLLGRPWQAYNIQAACLLR